MSRKLIEDLLNQLEKVQKDLEETKLLLDAQKVETVQLKSICDRLTVEKKQLQ